VQSAEWLAYQSALAGLAAAKSVTPALQAANAALAAADSTAAAVLTATEWTTSHGASLFDIQEIRLSGTLRTIITGGDAFNAVVKGRVVAQDFNVQLSFDPRKTGEFLSNLFNQWVYIYITMPNHLNTVLLATDCGEK
jgi:hypothetical protein